MNIEDTAPANEPHYRGHSLENVKGICGVPARLSGFVSWCIQLFLLVLSAVLTALLFVHIGGYSYFVPAQNSTGVIEHFVSDINGSYVAPESLLFNETDDVTIDTVRILTGNDTKHQKIYHGPFEQIDDVHLVLFGKVGIDLLPCIRTINALYIIFCVLWLITLGGLLLSLKLELTDLFCPNLVFLMIAIVTMLVESLIIGILLFYQKEYNWPILLVISGTVGGLLFSFILAIFAFALLVVWYKYVNYMNNRKDACVCLSTITNFVKRRRNPARNNASSDYTIPEATNHSHLPYIDDPPVQQFSNF